MRRRQSAACVVLAAALVVAFVVAVGIGSVPVPPLTLGKLVLHGFGVPGVAAPDQQDVAILLLLRLPRVLAAVLVGGALATCGVVMQGLFRNPMASPEILGISAGGSLGAVIAIVTGLAGWSLFTMPILTVAGAFVSAACIYALSTSRGTTSLLFIVIAGMAISSLFNALTSGLLLFSRHYEVSQYLFWTMGGLDGRTWQHILMSAPVLVPGIVVLCLFSRDLNLFALGEEGASALGVGVETTKRLLLAISAIVTGVSIAVAGPIGFVGLLVPHLMRFVVGPDHRGLMPASALGGGLFLVVCDLAGRAIAPPYEIRVGIITALLGSPYLIVLLVRTQKRGTRVFLS